MPSDQTLSSPRVTRDVTRALHTDRNKYGIHNIRPTLKSWGRNSTASIHGEDKTYTEESGWIIIRHDLGRKLPIGVVVRPQSIRYQTNNAEKLESKSQSQKIRAIEE